MPNGTVPVTGVRPGMTGMRPTQVRPGFFQQIRIWWFSLTKKQKMVVGGSVVLTLILFGGMLKLQQASAYVNLYENPLSAGDVGDVSQALAEMNIPYRRTPDSHITVSPAERVKALAELTKQGLPRHPFSPLPLSQIGESHEAFTALQNEQLERDLTMVIRQFQEISDANVKLVIPSDRFWALKEETAKAAVVVKLKPGYDSLPLAEAKSIVRLVAYSVPNLKPENVQLTDTQGRLLSDLLKNSDDQVNMDKMLEKKKEMQSQYEAQIAKMLDKVLGSSRYAVAVNVDTNWDQEEKTITTKGNPETNATGAVPEQQQVFIERYSKGGGEKSGYKQVGIPGVEGETENQINENSFANNPLGTPNANPGGNYSTQKILTKWAVNENSTRTIVTPGQPLRVTATVLADETLSPMMQRRLTQAIKDSIGFNADRDDQVYFGTLPFHREEIAMLSQAMNKPGFMRYSSLFSGALALRLAMALLIAGLIGIGIYFYRHQKALGERTKLSLEAGSTATVSDISDLFTDKTGKVTIPAPEPVQETEKLEELVKEKPTRVAELLRTTWLAER